MDVLICPAPGSGSPTTISHPPRPWPRGAADRGELGAAAAARPGARGSARRAGADAGRGERADGDGPVRPGAGGAADLRRPAAAGRDTGERVMHGAHPEWADNLIANKLGCSDMTVTAVRTELEATRKFAGGPADRQRTNPLSRELCARRRGWMSGAISSGERARVTTSRPAGHRLIAVRGGRDFCRATTSPQR
jgi:hypothetical protein